jgi:hypothetical protein
MREQSQTGSRETIGIGALTSIIGGYFLLVAFGIVPPPGGQEAVHAPEWVIVCAGLVFLLGGFAVMVQGVGRASPATGELPPGTPRALLTAQHLLVLLVATCMAAIGSWIAFGPGARPFTLSTPMFETRSAAEIVGRTAFGLGAVIVWIYVIALAVTGVRKLIGRDRSRV